MTSQVSGIPVPSLPNLFSQPVNTDMGQKKQVSDLELDSANVLCLLAKSGKENTAPLEDSRTYKQFSVSAHPSNNEMEKVTSNEQIARQFNIPLKKLIKKPTRNATKGLRDPEGNDLTIKFIKTYIKMCENNTGSWDELATKFGQTAGALRSRVTRLIDAGEIPQNARLNKRKKNAAKA